MYNLIFPNVCLTFTDIPIFLAGYIPISLEGTPIKLPQNTHSPSVLRGQAFTICREAHEEIPQNQALQVGVTNKH